MSSKPVRVCLNCYEKLQKPNAAATAVENNKPPLSSSGEDSEDDDKDGSKTSAADHDEARFYGDGERNNGTAGQ